MPSPRTLITRKRLTSLLAAMRKKRIVVVGDAMLDVYLGGDVERISPEAPVPVVKVRERRYAMGGAANVAQNVAAAGARVSLVGAAGADQAGVRLEPAICGNSASPTVLWDGSMSRRATRCSGHGAVPRAVRCRRSCIDVSA